MLTKARFATAHRIAFPAIRTAEDLAPLTAPAASLSWKIGPSGELGPNGYRLPDRIWCAVGLYRDRAAAESALANPQASMPFLAEATESWHALLQPTAHKGICNHLDRANPTELFDFPAADPGGRLMVITTAGFNPGPDFSIDRVIYFRRRVDTTNAWMATQPGCLANQVFTPYTVGDDGVTMTIWQEDAAMIAAAYRPGTHRDQIDHHMEKPMIDRSSFTRFRILASTGTWNGANPATT